MIGELINHLWQSTLFAVAVGLVTVAFGKNRAEVRYGLWLSASFKFFVPFTLLINLGDHLEHALSAKKIVTHLAMPALSLTMVQLTRPFADTSAFVPAAQGSSKWVVIALGGAWACGFSAVVLIRLWGWLRIRACWNVAKWACCTPSCWCPRTS